MERSCTRARPAKRHAARGRTRATAHSRESRSCFMGVAACVEHRDGSEPPRQLVRALYSLTVMGLIRDIYVWTVRKKYTFLTIRVL